MVASVNGWEERRKERDEDHKQEVNAVTGTKIPPCVLSMEVKQWMKENRNQNTEASYTSAMKRFQTWCGEQSPSYQFNPPTEAVVASYLRYLVIEQQSPISSVKQMVNVLKPLAVSSTSKKPLTLQQVKDMAAKVTATQYESATRWSDCRDFMMALLAFTALLRASEVARMKMEDVTMEQCK
jgi:site-specific recombinase XerD